VPRDADAEAFEAARLAVERGLDEVHARAYALVGSRDPGARVAGVPLPPSTGHTAPEREPAR
jgi:hypothetical protein